MADLTVPALPESRALALTVESATDLTPMLRRVRLTGGDLVGFRHVAGQDLMMAIPTDDGQTINRRYTIRRYVPDAPAVDIDIVAHGNGPGARWARTAAPGSEVAAIGPRGKVVPVESAAWHLFACDESGWPATAAMVESLGAGRTALVLAEIDGPREVQPLVSAAGVRIEWLERGTHRPGDPALLVDAMRAATFPDRARHAYLSAELSVVRDLGTLLGARGFSPEEMSPKAYWRLGVSNAPHGEPPRTA
jgi:NADPH-dependent ferric siderophore reductase